MDITEKEFECILNVTNEDFSEMQKKKIYDYCATACDAYKQVRPDPCMTVIEGALENILKVVYTTYITCVDDPTRIRLIELQNDRRLQDFIKQYASTSVLSNFILQVGHASRMGANNSKHNQNLSSSIDDAEACLTNLLATVKMLCVILNDPKIPKYKPLPLNGRASISCTCVEKGEEIELLVTTTLESDCTPKKNPLFDWTIGKERIFNNTSNICRVKKNKINEIAKVKIVYDGYSGCINSDYKIKKEDFNSNTTSTSRNKCNSGSAPAISNNSKSTNQNHSANTITPQIDIANTLDTSKLDISNNTSMNLSQDNSADKTSDKNRNNQPINTTSSQNNITNAITDTEFGKIINNLGKTETSVNSKSATDAMPQLNTANTTLEFTTAGNVTSSLDTEQSVQNTTAEKITPQADTGDKAVESTSNISVNKENIAKKTNQNKSAKKTVDQNDSTINNVDSVCKTKKINSKNDGTSITNDCKKQSTKKNTQRKTTKSTDVTSFIDSQLSEIELMLEKGEFNEAKRYLSPLSESHPGNATIALYGLMISYKCKKRTDLAKLHVPFTDRKYFEDDYYQQIIDSSDSAIKKEVTGYLNTIFTRMRTIPKDLQIGDELFFGTNDHGESIRWVVLDIVENNALLLSKEIICWKIFGDSKWKNSISRKWLNNDFIKASFTTRERLKILSSSVITNNRKHPLLTTTTNDKIVLLSTEEVEHYEGIISRHSHFVGSYLLRTPGYNSKTVTIVDESASSFRDASIDKKNPIRPAMWILLD